MRWQAPDSDFELLRQAASTRPRPAAILVAALVTSMAFAVHAWLDLQRAKAQAVASAAQLPQDDAALLAASRAARLQAEVRAAALPGPRQLFARWMDDVERCHPEGAQVLRANFDTISGSGTLQVSVAGGLRLSDWARCLNSGAVPGVWKLREVAEESALSGVVRVEWGQAAPVQVKP